MGWIEPLLDPGTQGNLRVKGNPRVSERVKSTDLSAVFLQTEFTELKLLAHLKAYRIYCLKRV